MIFVAGLLQTFFISRLFIRSDRDLRLRDLGRKGDLELARRPADRRRRRLACCHLPLRRRRRSTDLDGRTRLRLRRLCRLGSATNADFPEPRLVIDDFHLIAIGECGKGLAGLGVLSVPAAWGEVDEGSLEATHGDNINALNESPAEVNEGLFDPPPTDVVEDAWNAKANAMSRVGILGEVVHTRLAGRASGRGSVRHLRVRHV